MIDSMYWKNESFLIFFADIPLFILCIRMFGYDVFLCIVSSQGGLCFHDDDVKVFARNQLAKCSGCTGREDNYCEICTNDGNTCYYPYNPKQ